MAGDDAVRAAVALAALVVLAGCAGSLPLNPLSASPEDAGFPDDSFREVSDETGLDYTAVPAGIENGGVFVADYDRDGWPDVLALGGDDPALFRNAGGEFERSDALPEDLRGAFKTALWVDYDRDGWEDLVLFREYRTPVFLENREGAFERRQVGLDTRMDVPKSASAADYDGDGCPDLFVAQNADWDNTTPEAGKPANMGGMINGTEDNGNPNYLYRGTCEGFERVEDAGISGEYWSLSTSFADLTGDGRPDVYVANDFNNDTLYVNEGDGTFEKRILAEYTDRNAMASEIADFDGDHRPDVFVTNIFVPGEFRVNLIPVTGRMNGNNLLLNGGNGTFRDVAAEWGVAQGGWGWAATATDLDNDGDRDLFHTTSIHKMPPGARSDRLQDMDNRPTYLDYPVLFARTAPDNFTGVNTTRVGFEQSSGRGLATLDFDRDGDRDLLIAVVQGEFKLYENTLGGRSLQVDVEGGREDGPLELGARVYATVDGETRVYYNNAKADFLSQDSRVHHVGLGDGEVQKLRVVWPDGTERVWTNVSANRRVTVYPNGTKRGVAT
jgi:hypothetical protein